MHMIEKMVRKAICKSWNLNLLDVARENKRIK